MNLTDISQLNVYNDGIISTQTIVNQIGTFEALYFSFLVWVFSVVLHELGHWFMLLKHNKDAEIRVKRVGYGIQLMTGEEKDYENLTKDNKTYLYVVGILLGFLPILMASLVHPIFLLVLPAYIVGTYSDFQKLWYLIRDNDTN